METIQVKTTQNSLTDSVTEFFHNGKLIHTAYDIDYECSDGCAIEEMLEIMDKKGIIKFENISEQ